MVVEHRSIDVRTPGPRDQPRRRSQIPGMSAKLGSVRYAGERLQCLGAAVAVGNDASAATREMIDVGVRRIVAEQLRRRVAWNRSGGYAVAASSS